ncbi:conserved hypothetical protein [Streptomyces sviceus ATCC 29083]|uniref:Uncharacterized protein n=1 Tax=Streptomyces sviceus (strain ATCC 29083 / DSM 924 / JCM 4929 / NBRC 13980 / NCIMB 11184 / NRRL 5439 / UC 5370) TaxID=463191 RepID=B5I8X5_STRX2|nr:conserved hypothetical protein [Streptomyces sviceus ATCC 29083]
MATDQVIRGLLLDVTSPAGPPPTGGGSEQQRVRLLAVTACPTGFAHTYMAAEKRSGLKMSSTTTMSALRTGWRRGSTTLRAGSGPAAAASGDDGEQRSTVYALMNGVSYVIPLC